MVALGGRFVGELRGGILAFRRGKEQDYYRSRIARRDFLECRPSSRVFPHHLSVPRCDDLEFRASADQWLRHPARGGEAKRNFGRFSSERLSSEASKTEGKAMCSKPCASRAADYCRPVHLNSATFCARLSTADRDLGCARTAAAIESRPFIDASEKTGLVPYGHPPASGE